MSNKLYWLWLTLKKNITHREISLLLRTFGGPDKIYEIEDIELLKNFSKKIQGFVLDKSLKYADSILTRTEQRGERVVTIEDDEYPPLLKHIDEPPYVLYMYGETLDWENLLTITVVGTRKYNKYGRNATQRLTYDLSKAGVTIVSGMARGIDSIAGTTALQAGGKTVAVLGSGLDRIYPSEKRGLYKNISKNGVVITEYPLGAPPSKHHFPRRNRIMAGLSYGALVTQAPKKSGALITANYAIESGRDVFAVPGTMFSPGSEGCNRLIVGGAKLTMSYKDILVEYPYFHFENPDKLQPCTSSAERVENIDYSMYNENQQRIIRLLLGGEIHIDEMNRILEMDRGILNTELLVLELNGAIIKLDGDIYKLVL